MGSTHPGTPLEPAELYDALSNDRRRACLTALAATDAEMPVRDLADAVASETVGDLKNTAKSTYISLIQIHLPKLADYEIITYDTEEKVVAPGPAYTQAMTCLTAHTGDGEPTVRDHLPTLVWGVSLVALALALFVPTYTRLVLWVVLTFQLVGLLATMDSALQAARLERIRR